MLADLPEEQRPVAERALQGGIPAVRQAVNEQNVRLKAEGKPEVPAAGLLSMAEQLLPSSGSPSGSTAPTQPRPTSKSSICATCAAWWPPGKTRWSPATNRPVRSPPS